MKATNIIMKSIPLLAPVPAMWSVYAAASNKLVWPQPIAIAAALTVEGLGFVSVNLAERMYTYNKGLRMDERAQKWLAPTWQAIVTTGVYLVVVLSMIVLMDIMPNITSFLPLAFPILGITGAAVWAMNNEQEERERLVSEYRAKKKSDRKKDEAQSGACAPSADAVRKGTKRSAVASAPSADAVRAQCAALSAQYACTEAQCGWSPSVDALIASAGAGKNAKSAAASAKAGHVKNNHRKKDLADALFESVSTKGDQA